MSTKKAKILVVEDSKVIQNLIQQALNFTNYEGTIAKNGLEGVEILKKHDFDLVLLDLDMPIMDGYTCIQFIRSLPNPQKANIPIISITGNNLDLSEKEFGQLGFTDKLTKPIDFSELDRLLRKYLQE